MTNTSGIDRAALALAWAAVVVAVALLAWRLPELPDVVPAYRGPSGMVWMPKSAVAVLRVPLINAAMTTIVTVLFRRVRHPGWRRVVRAALVALALKSLAGAVEWAVLGTRWATVVQTLALLVTMLAVVYLLVVMLVARKRLGLPFRGEHAPAWRELPTWDRAIVLAAAAAWPALATLPLWTS